MKKLFLASVFALATLTSCNNSEAQITPEEQQHQTFQSKNTAREADPADEKEAVAQAIEIIKKDVEVGGGSNSKILCHTSYLEDTGHACVQIGSYLVNVTWHPLYTSHDGNIGLPVDEEFNPIIYDGAVVPRCNC